MAVPPPPPPLETLINRPFSFYPPILNVESNEWFYRKATWSEVLVVNRKSNNEIWIPRRFIGEISRIDEPVVIVGLVKELEYKGGAVWPYQRRIIEMPIAVNAAPAPAGPSREERAPVVGIRLEPRTEAPMLKLILACIIAGVLACVAVLMYFRGGPLRQRVTLVAKDQSYLELNRNDDYYDVVRKLGQPTADRWKADATELQFRALSYPDHGYTVILMGTDQKSAHYIGTVDRNWLPLHSIGFRDGDMSSMLRNLKPF